MMSVSVEYVGKDLEAMDFAENYHRWILDIFRPFLGRRLVEVGAGTGSFSNLLLETTPEALSLVEPSAMYETLVESVPRNGGSTTISHYRNIFTAVANDIKRAEPDTVLYINVLEHIENDVDELRAVHQTLLVGGRVCIFVPSVPFLLSEFDRRIGHFRRYKRKELVRKCDDAGFKSRLVRSFDAPGILPWLVKYRLLGSTTMESSAVQLYDRVAVPIIRRIESVLHPPIGKNLIYVGEKV